MQAKAANLTAEAQRTLYAQLSVRNHIRLEMDAPNTVHWRSLELEPSPSLGPKHFRMYADKCERAIVVVGDYLRENGT